LAGQWLNYPTPGIPRKPDGKPDLTAAAPRMPDGKPDLSGLWRDDQAGSGATQRAVADMKVQPWVEQLAEKRKAELFKDDPGTLCLPDGVRAGGGVRKIIQIPKILAILFDDLTYRQVFVDGRPLPQDPNPAWMGYSVGHWDGDTLVIQSAGFNDRTWLDGEGHSHSESLRLTERVRRPNFGHLEIEQTFEDPKALAKPLIVPVKLELDADTEMIEYVCAENERDRPHLVGHASDETKDAVKVSAQILSKYTGAYEFHPPDRPDSTVMLNVSLTGEQLMFDVEGGRKLPLTPLSDTRFFLEGGAHIEFVTDNHGVVTHMIARIVEGDIKAVRRTAK
jgi:hypothetical protein